MKVSPGVIMLTKLSSISPRLPPRWPISRTFSTGISMMVPMFMRAWRAMRAERISIWPSALRNRRR